MELIELLLNKHADVEYHDFYIPEIRRSRKYDFEFLQKNSKLIVDTRGRLDRDLSNVISA